MVTPSRNTGDYTSSNKLTFQGIIAGSRIPTFPSFHHSEHQEEAGIHHLDQQALSWLPILTARPSIRPRLDYIRKLLRDNFHVSGQVRYSSSLPAWPHAGFARPTQFVKIINAKSRAMLGRLSRPRLPRSSTTRISPFKYNNFVYRLALPSGVVGSSHVIQTTTGRVPIPAGIKQFRPPPEQPRSPMACMHQETRIQNEVGILTLASAALRSYRAPRCTPRLRLGQG